MIPLSPFYADLLGWHQCEVHMNKLDLSPTPLAYVANSNMDLASFHRLIVLLPIGTDYNAATRPIWELANATSMHVQLLGLCKDADDELSLRRELITMASLLQDENIAAEAKVVIGTNWLDIVRTNYKPNDMVVYFSERHIGFLGRSLSQILESDFKATVYILSGFTPQKSKSNKLTQILAWMGCIAIIICFGILQTKVVQLPEGWLQSVLLILSIIPEFWLIWICNSLFG